MIHKLENGDKVYFLKNINYEFNIVESTRFWLYESQTMISDDPKMPLFKDLIMIYWNLRKNNSDLSNYISQSKRYLSYALVNGEYKIVFFGRTIYDMIYQEGYYLNRLFNIVLKQAGPYSTYDNCYFSDEKIEVSDEFLLTKTMNFEDVDKGTMWTNKKQYDSLMKFFKKYYVDVKHIDSIKRKQRELKLERIL